MFEHVVWLIPMVVGGLGAWRPRAGLVALVASLPFFGSPPGGPYLAALDVTGLAAIFTAWRGGKLRPTPLDWPVAAFVVVSIVSLAPITYLPPAYQPRVLLDLLRSLPAVESWPALYAWRAAADLLLGWGLFLTFRRSFAGRSARPLALALLAGLVPVLLLGLASQAGLLTLDAYRPLNGAGRPLPRLHSIFFLSGWLSEYIVLATPLAIAALATGGRWMRSLAVPLIALALACLALTQQRGAWVAAAAQVVCWAAVSAPRWRRHPLRLRRAALVAAVSGGLAVVILLGATASLAPVRDRARSIRSGVVPRTKLWTTAAEMTRERPLLGWGLGSFAAAYELRYPRGSPEAPRSRDTAHSLYFQVVAERGLLGLVALAVLAWAAYVCLRRPRSGQETLALALGLCLVGTAVYGLVQYMLYVRSLAWLQWLLLGGVAVIGPDRATTAASRAARTLVAGALLLLPLRAILGAPPPYAGNRSFGFHATEAHPEGPFQWTEGVAARRLPWTGRTLVMSLANGHPRASQRPVTVTVGVDGEKVATLTIAGGWEEHRFPLGPPSKAWVVLTIRAQPTFRPFSDFRSYPELGRSVDIRSLGIAVKNLHWEIGLAGMAEGGQLLDEAVRSDNP